MTIDAVRERRKTVTRRHVDTWRSLAPGDELTLVEKGMGLPKGASQVVLDVVTVVDVRVEPLHLISHDDDYGWAEVVCEGFPEMEPYEFAEFWLDSHGVRVATQDEFMRVLLEHWRESTARKDDKARAQRGASPPRARQGPAGAVMSRGRLFFVYEDPEPGERMRWRREVWWSEATPRDHELAIERLLDIRSEVDKSIRLHREAIGYDEQLDAAEMVVFHALSALGCPVAVDPVDPDDCASVAVEAVRALRSAGWLLVRPQPPDPGRYTERPQPPPAPRAPAGRPDTSDRRGAAAGRERGLLRRAVRARWPERTGGASE